MIHKLLYGAGLVLAMAAVAWAAAQEAADPYAQALTYRAGQPRTPLGTIEAEIRAASPEQLRAIEAKLLGILQSPSATAECKDWVCRQLRLAGSEQAVPALAALLGDKQWNTVARLALQSVRGAKVDAALRGALGSLQGELKAGVIQTLGARADRQAVPLLGPLAGDADPVIAEMALYALGHIGGADALEAVQKAKVPAGLKRYQSHAVLLCLERMVSEGSAAQAAAGYQALYQQSDDTVIKTAALRGIVTTRKAQAVPVLVAALKSDNARLRGSAAKFASEAGGAEVLGPVLADLASLPPDVQVTLLSMVADKAAAPAVMAAAKSPEEQVRLAALGAIGRIGDASSVPMLLALSREEKGEVQATARKSLQELRGREADESLVAAAQQGPPAARVEAIRALAARSTTAAAPMLLKAANDADPTIQNEALAALGVLADAGTVPALVQLLVEAKSEGRRGAVEAAVVAACRRGDDREAAAAGVSAAMAGASPEVRGALLRVLARVPSAKSLAALRASAGDAEASVKDAAIRGLAGWPEPAVMVDLLGIARTSSSQVHKVLALRGLARLAALPNHPAPAQAVKLLGEALPLAARPEEKKTILAALGEIGHPAALELALGCLQDQDAEIEAATAVVKIAKKVRKTDIDAAGRAIQKVLDVCKSPAARQVAESAVIVVDGMVNIAPQGTATSPDGLEKDGGAGGDQAAIDGDPSTYWDEADGQKLYRLVVTFKQPEKIAAVSLVGYEHQNFAPKDFEVLCDGKAVKKVENAQYDDNFLVVRLPETTCASVELRITGCYGQSPAIRELGIYRAAARR